VPKIKHVIDNLGRCEKDGYAKGTHFVQILTYGQNKKEPKMWRFPTRMQGLSFSRFYSLLKGGVLNKCA
jgi:hypothetical protein